MAQILYGKAVVEALKIKFQKENEYWASKNIAPKIAIVRVGNKKDDIAYEARIEKNCNELGVELIKSIVDDNINTVNLIKFINNLNQDDSVHGILVFRPLPDTIDTMQVKNSINPIKDIDSMTSINAEKIFSGDKNALAPCTPLAVIEILEFYNYDLSSLKIGIVNRSLVLGKPLAMMLLEKNATISIGHSKTKDLTFFTQNSDIVITGIGKADFFNAGYFNKNSTIIDVGINFNENGMCGDVDFKSVEPIANAISPVPGGVGTVTSMMLFMNLMKAMKMQNIQFR